MKSGYLVTYDGVRLYYETFGSGGRTLVIPNGLYFRRDFEPLAGSRTVIYYDVRNRGKSDSVMDPAKLGGIPQDVEDLEAVRKHFDLQQMDLLGHSYVASMVALYAVKNPARVGRLVQMGPMTPFAGKQYPPELAYQDATTGEVFSKLGAMQKEGFTGTPEEICKKVSSVLSMLCVVDRADAAKVDWGRCDQPNESGFMRYWTAVLMPSLQKLVFTEKEVSRLQSPVLVVHGRKDRNAPYGGGRDWAKLWPEARLMTIDNAAHAPWVEAREFVLKGLEEFFQGRWPEGAAKVGNSLP